MKFSEFAESRKSVRGFLDKAVPKEVIEEMTTNPNAVNNTSIPWFNVF